MPLNETKLKQHLSTEKLARVYFLYGDEPYLTGYYSKQIASLASGDSPLAEFNQQFIDGTICTVDDIGEAVEALPVMAEQKSVLVRDYDVSKANANQHDRLIDMLKDLPDSCVLIFWQDSVSADVSRNAKWRAFSKQVQKSGIVSQLNQRTQNQLITLLISGAKRRKAILSRENALLMIQRSGSDMSLLLGEIEKLSAAAGENGEITRELVMGLGVENLEASIFSLSSALLNGDATQAYSIIHRLISNSEQPVVILSVLSGAYVDLYRAKIAVSAGQRAQSLAQDFSYRGREWLLRNAERDSRALSVCTLRKCLDCLADADRMLKSTSVDDRIILEQTIAKLMLLAKEENI